MPTDDTFDLKEENVWKITQSSMQKYILLRMDIYSIHPKSFKAIAK